MIKEETIRKLVDYILLNACSVNSSGLYNGKAGMALALFETSRYLKDEYIEEQAFELLQESLLIKTDNISFEKGLSGIGYVLIYLINNEFIYADFEELFGEQYEKIITGIDKFKKNPNVLLNSILISYFLTSLQSLRPADKRIDRIMKSLFKANELHFSSQFFDFKYIDYINNKNAVLERFEIYLQMVSECQYVDYSRVVLEDYTELYRSGRIMSSYKIAYYLQVLDQEGKYKNVIESNRRYSYVDNSKVHTLKNQIDLAKLSGKIDNLQELISAENEENFEKAILQSIPPGTFTAGYEHGLSKLLIYLTNKKTILL